MRWTISTFDHFPPPGGPAYNVFFSARVLEHVPSPTAILHQALTMVRPGGLVITVVPNGTDGFRRDHPRTWQQLWRKVHPNLLDDRYVAHEFADQPTFLTSLAPGGLSPTQQASLAFGRGGASGEIAVDAYEFVFGLRRPD